MNLIERLRREADAELFGETVCAEAADRIAELDDALRKACALAECERWHERFPKCHAAMIKALEQKVNE